MFSLIFQWGDFGIFLSDRFWDLWVDVFVIKYIDISYNNPESLATFNYQDYYALPFSESIIFLLWMCVIFLIVYTRNRPPLPEDPVVSPHLTIYNQQAGSVGSILHRLTGVFMVVSPIILFLDHKFLFIESLMEVVVQTATTVHSPEENFPKLGVYGQAYASPSTYSLIHFFIRKAEWVELLPPKWAYWNKEMNYGFSSFHKMNPQFPLEDVDQIRSNLSVPDGDGVCHSTTFNTLCIPIIPCEILKYRFPLINVINHFFRLIEVNPIEIGHFGYGLKFPASTLCCVGHFLTFPLRCIPYLNTIYMEEGGFKLVTAGARSVDELFRHFCLYSDSVGYTQFFEFLRSNEDSVSEEHWLFLSKHILTGGHHWSDEWDSLYGYKNVDFRIQYPEEPYKHPVPAPKERVWRSLKGVFPTPRELKQSLDLSHLLDVYVQENMPRYRKWEIHEIAEIEKREDLTALGKWLLITPLWAEMMCKYAAVSDKVLDPNRNIPLVEYIALCINLSKEHYDSDFILFIERVINWYAAFRREFHDVYSSLCTSVSTFFSGGEKFCIGAENMIYKILWWGFSFSLVFHTIHGINHWVWDGVAKETSFYSLWKGELNKGVYISLFFFAFFWALYYWL